MSAQTRLALLSAMVCSAALASMGCDSGKSPETVGQKVDRAADKMATATEKATTQAAKVMDDATITAKVRAAVTAEPGLSALQINVDTKNSVVTLTGTVDTPAMRERALQVAHGINGVQSVVDNLVVKSTQSG